MFFGLKWSVAARSSLRENLLRCPSCTSGSYWSATTATAERERERESAAAAGGAAEAGEEEKEEEEATIDVEEDLLVAPVAPPEEQAAGGDGDGDGAHDRPEGDGHLAAPPGGAAGLGLSWGAEHGHRIVREISLEFEVSRGGEGRRRRTLELVGGKGQRIKRDGGAVALVARPAADQRVSDNAGEDSKSQELGDQSTRPSRENLTNLLKITED